MNSYNATFVNLTTLLEARKAIQSIGSDSQSISIMAPKAISKAIKIDNVLVQDAIIIKQDMLSLGGEVAIPKEAFFLEKKYVSILIMGTVKQLFELVEKLNRHYPRLQKLATELSSLVKKID
jgi:dihydropteroate synthase